MKQTLIVTLLLVAHWSHSALAAGFTLLAEDATGQLDKQQVFQGFGCDGKNISPALSWQNAPKGTKSFAVTVYDKDAPTGGGWWHWLVVNIPASEVGLKENAGNVNKGLAPKGSVQSMTSFGMNGYGGACPPEGDAAHQYLFTVYALNVDRLEVSVTSTPAYVGYLLNNTVIAKASTVAYYQR